MTTPAQDAEHLRLLSIFHYVWGGLTALLACIPIFHVALGVVMMVAPQNFEHGQSPPKWLGLFLAALGGGLILLGWTLGALTIYAGRCLAQRRRHLFCMIVAGLNCLSIPFGTLLGVFTLLVLSRPTVKAQFA